MPEGVDPIEREVPAFAFSHQPGVRCVRMHRLTVPLGKQPVMLLPLVTKACLVAVLIMLVGYEQFRNRSRQVNYPC